MRDNNLRQGPSEDTRPGRHGASPGTVDRLEGPTKRRWIGLASVVTAVGAGVLACAESPTAVTAGSTSPHPAANGTVVAARGGVVRLLTGANDAGSVWQVRGAPNFDRRNLASAPTLFESTFDARADGSDPLTSDGWLSAPEFGTLAGSTADVAEFPSAGAIATTVTGRLALSQRDCVAVRVVQAAPITLYLVTFTLSGARRDEPRLYIVDLADDHSATRNSTELLQQIRLPGRVEGLREVADWSVSSAEWASRLVTVPVTTSPDPSPPPPGDSSLRERALWAKVTVAADGSATWSVLFSSLWRTRSLGLAVCGSIDGPTWIDDFRVQELTAADVLALSPGEPGSFDLPRPWENRDSSLPITKVRCEWESRRALLLTRGGVARCEFIAPPGHGGRVELGLALVREERLCVRGTRRERAIVRWNGAVAEHELELEFDHPDGFRDVTLPLPAQGGPCVLQIELAGATDRASPLLAISDPLLYASDPAAAPAAVASPGEVVPRNVVLISLDTLRADRLGRKRNGRSLTPRLDDLAARSVRFRTALANASYTLPSHVSLFTSQRPGEHGVLTVFDALDWTRSESLVRIAARHGYAAAAFTSGGMLNAEFCGIDTGFDRYGEIDALLSPDDRLRDIAPLQQRAAYNRELAAARRLDTDVLPWLRTHGGAPFVLFLHSYLTHNYQPEPELRAEFTRGLPPTPLRLHGPAPHLSKLNTTHLESPEGRGETRFSFIGEGAQEFVPDRDLPMFEALYDATVVQADREVGRILDEIDRLGLAERTIVVVTSDHGEEFFEHGDLSHAHSLFDEILRVPLLIHVPGVVARDVDDPVEHIDVAPTLLAAMRLPIDPRMRGDDLLAPGFLARRVTLHEGTGGLSAGPTLRAARRRDGKLIVTEQVGGGEATPLSSANLQVLQALGYLQSCAELPDDLAARFFDLAADPGEHRDLAGTRELPREQALRFSDLVHALAEAPFLTPERR
ncbi:MAG: hypothetical protein EXS13_06585 [Planctomycetes bacterium]|nr:hypothetical protein [Planctomycetota bacterium]